MERYYYLADLLISRHYPVLLSGDVGVGKSTLVEVSIQFMNAFNWHYNLISGQPFISKCNFECATEFYLFPVFLCPALHRTKT